MDVWGDENVNGEEGVDKDCMWTCWGDECVCVCMCVCGGGGGKCDRI